MSRYIEADKVLKELHLNHKDVIYIDKNDTARRIEKIPTIDIVFCKECKYEGRCRKAVEHITHEPTSVTIGCKAVDFCSYGEREGE